MAAPDKSFGGPSLGHAVMPANAVRLGGDARIGLAPHDAEGAPTIDLIKEGDVVRAIEIVCACGKKIRLRCVYSDR